MNLCEVGPNFVVMASRFAVFHKLSERHILPPIMASGITAPFTRGWGIRGLAGEALCNRHPRFGHCSVELQLGIGDVSGLRHDLAKLAGSADDAFG